MNPEKLAKLQEQVRTGGKGTPRRKMKKASAIKSSSSACGVESSSKMQSFCKKMHTQTLGGIEEVNMFRSDGNVIHFENPRVDAAVPSNTFVISGRNATKELTELAPGILSQLGPHALADLQRMALEYQRQAEASGLSLEQLAQMAAAAGKNGSAGGVDDIPDLVKNFESAEIDAN